MVQVSPSPLAVAKARSHWELASRARITHRMRVAASGSSTPGTSSPGTVPGHGSGRRTTASWRWPRCGPTAACTTRCTRLPAPPPTTSHAAGPIRPSARIRLLAAALAARGKEADSAAGR